MFVRATNPVRRANEICDVPYGTVLEVPYGTVLEVPYGTVQYLKSEELNCFKDLCFAPSVSVSAIPIR